MNKVSDEVIVKKINKLNNELLVWPDDLIDMCIERQEADLTAMMVSGLVRWKHELAKAFSHTERQIFRLQKRERAAIRVLKQLAVETQKQIMPDQENTRRLLSLVGDRKRGWLEIAKDNVACFDVL